MLQQMQGQHNLHKAKKSLHGNGLADRNSASHALFVYGKRLYQEWVVDQYSKVESQRLFYIRNNQGPLRAAIYGGLCRNPSFGLATKAKGIARVRAKGKPGS